MHSRPTMGQRVPRSSTSPPLLGQAAGQAVGIADGGCPRCGGGCLRPGKPGRSLRPRRAAACAPTPPGPARTKRAADPGRAGWAFVAGHAVEGDAGPGPGAGLERQVPDAVAGLDVGLAGVETPGTHPGEGVIEQLQLAAGVVPVFLRQAVGKRTDGKRRPGSAEASGHTSGDGGQVSGGDAQTCMPVSRARWTESGMPRAARAAPWASSATVWVRSQCRSSGACSGAVYPRIRICLPIPARRRAIPSARQATAKARTPQRCRCRAAGTAPWP